MEERPPCEDGGRDCSDASICQRMPKIAVDYQKVGRIKEGLFPSVFRGIMTLRQFDFELPTSHICERINVVFFLSHLVCSMLLLQPYEINSFHVFECVSVRKTCMYVWLNT